MVALIEDQKEKKEGDEKMTKRKNPAIYMIKITLALVFLVLCVAVVFWGTFSVTLSLLDLFNIYVDPCVPAIFSALITSLILVYIWIVSFYSRR